MIWALAPGMSTYQWEPKMLLALTLGRAVSHSRLSCRCAKLQQPRTPKWNGVQLSLCPLHWGIVQRLVEVHVPRTHEKSVQNLNIEHPDRQSTCLNRSDPLLFTYTAHTAHSVWTLQGPGRRNQEKSPGCTAGHFTGWNSWSCTSQRLSRRLAWIPRGRCLGWSAMT